MHVNFNPNTPSSRAIDFETFLQVDVRIGQIVDVQDFPEAKNPSYKLLIDFGEAIGLKKSSAQITHHYSIQDLKDKKIMAVINFPPRQIGKFMSEVLVLGFSDINNQVVLFNLDKDVPNGSRMH